MPLVLVQRHGCPRYRFPRIEERGAQAARLPPRIAAPHAMMVSGFLLLLPPPPPPIHQSCGSAQARTPLFPASIWESHQSFPRLPLSPASPKLRSPPSAAAGRLPLSLTRNHFCLRDGRSLHRDGETGQPEKREKGAGWRGEAKERLGLRTTRAPSRLPISRDERDLRPRTRRGRERRGALELVMRQGRCPETCA